MYGIKEEAVIIEALLEGEMVVVPLTSSTLSSEIQEIFDRWCQKHPRYPLQLHGII